MIGDVHGISDRAASKCIHTVANAICDNMERFISWPNQVQISRTKQAFYERSGFPRVAGLIDGTQIPILGPYRPADQAVFVNRKGFHAINCQVVCNSNMKIMDFDAHWPGSTHDAFLLRNSHVADIFERGDMPNSWLLGDSGYGLSSWVMVPYLRPANDAQTRYNTSHKHARSTVERCIGVMKMR